MTLLIYYLLRKKHNILCFKLEEVAIYCVWIFKIGVNQQSHLWRVNMSEENKKHWFLRVLKHPLLVACASTGVFGVIIAWFGAEFQHRNWIKQEEISTQKTKQEKLFDQRSKLIRDVFYLMKNRELNTWNLYRAVESFKEAERYHDNDLMKRYAEEKTKYRDVEQGLASEFTAIKREMEIYFTMKKEVGISHNLSIIDEIWHNCIIHKIEQLTEAQLQDDLKQLNRYLDKLQNRFSEIMYKTQL